nr:unnamed protein product [Digitaria exilis]
MGLSKQAVHDDFGPNRGAHEAAAQFVSFLPVGHRPPSAKTGKPAAEIGKTTTLGHTPPQLPPLSARARDLHKRGLAMPAQVTQISAVTAAAAHVLCLAGLAAAHALAGRGALVSNPALALRLLVVCEAPVVIAVFSYLRRDRKSCSFIKAAARGLIGLPVGALLNAFGAIVLGAPVGIKSQGRETNFVTFQFVPAACVFGASKIDWQNVLSHSMYVLDFYFTPTDADNYIISVPCHGAVLGAWLGAWPMPLDWERPWQEWPICVTYGAVAGYLVGMAVSLVLIAVHKRRVRAKSD